MSLHTEIRAGFQAWANAPERKRSGEHDYGAWWTLDGNPRAWPHWRVSWIEDTGELYAVCEDGVHPDKFILIAVIATEKEVECALANWTDIAPNLPALIEQARTGTPQAKPKPAPRLEPEDFFADVDIGTCADGLSDVVADPALESTAAKVYRGQRPTDDSLGNCVVVVIEAGIARPLFHVKRHSPTGFEWGYAGSGPADLSLSILADHFGEQPQKFDGREYEACRSLRLYQEFKREVIAGLSRDDWTRTSDQIAAWVEKH
jgi:hypothetical protein